MTPKPAEPQAGSSSIAALAPTAPGLLALSLCRSTKNPLSRLRASSGAIGHQHQKPSDRSFSGPNLGFSEIQVLPVNLGEARLDAGGDVAGRHVFVGAASPVERFHLNAVRIEGMKAPTLRFAQHESTRMRT